MKSFSNGHPYRFSLIAFMTLGPACTPVENESTSPEIKHLSSTETVSAGQICTNGGVLIHDGYDHDLNGTLDSYEINSSETVCFDAVQYLSRTQDIEPGEECPRGGVRVQSGEDLNGNGVLDDVEVKSETITCFPETGSNDASLISVVDEEPGTNCTNGGTKISSGIDDDDDGVLDPEEVDAVEFICDEDPVVEPQPLVEVSDEPAGANCPYGGTRISSGNDDDSDGVLDPEEIDGTDYICDDPPPEDPLITLVRLDQEEPGENCPAGGTQISSGLDDNGNGVLEDEEIDSSQFICTPEVENPPPTLVLAETVLPGPDCPAGGTRVITGTDANEDEALSEDEIETATYICNGIPGDLNADRCVNGAILEGAVSLNSPEDIVALDGVVCVLGAVIIDGSTLENLQGLEALVEVSDDLVISNNAALTSLNGLDSLIEVKGKFVIQNNNILPAITGLGSLEDVRGVLKIGGNAELESITGFQSLQQLSGVLELEFNNALNNLSGFSTLIGAGGLVLDNNPSVLTLASLSSLSILEGSLFIYSMDGLSAIEFPSLESISSLVVIRFQEGPTLLSFPSLTFLGGSVFVEENSSIQTFSIPELTWLGGKLSISGNPALETVHADKLIYVSGDLYFGTNNALTLMRFDALKTIGGDFYCSSNPALESFEHLSALTSIGDNLILQALTNLQSFNGLGSLTSVGGLLHFYALEITSLSELESFNSVGGDCKFIDNPGLFTSTIQAFANGITIGGEVTIEGSPP